MSEQAGPSGELIYEYSPQVTQVVEYGASADAVFSGRTPPPPEGARFDLHLEGPVNGPRLTGAVKGVDYLCSSVFQLRENVTLTSNHPEYSWVNAIQLWAAGTVDVAKGEVHLKAYAA